MNVIEKTTARELAARLEALHIPPDRPIKVTIEELPAAETTPKKGKWAKIVEEAGAPLTGLSEYVMECSREIRENALFPSERKELEG